MRNRFRDAPKRGLEFYCHATVDLFQAVAEGVVDGAERALLHDNPNLRTLLQNSEINKCLYSRFGNEPQVEVKELNGAVIYAFDRYRVLFRLKKLGDNGRIQFDRESEQWIDYVGQKPSSLFADDFDNMLNLVLYYSVDETREVVTDAGLCVPTTTGELIWRAVLQESPVSGEAFAEIRACFNHLGHVLNGTLFG